MSGPEGLPPSLGVIDEVNTLGLKVTVLKTAVEPEESGFYQPIVIPTS